MISSTGKRSHRHTILHVSFSNSFGLASARPTPLGLSGAPLEGHLLFEIKIEDDKINETSIRAFKNGKVYLFSNKYQYVFNKDGSYERTRIVQRYWGETYHNYDAERWDALTDGMEGDYPGSGVDYDLLGF